MTSYSIYPIYYNLLEMDKILNNWLKNKVTLIIYYSKHRITVLPNYVKSGSTAILLNILPSAFYWINGIKWD